jgi:hypothetical protein
MNENLRRVGKPVEQVGKGSQLEFIVELGIAPYPRFTGSRANGDRHRICRQQLLRFASLPGALEDASKGARD